MKFLLIIPFLSLLALYSENSEGVKHEIVDDAKSTSLSQVEQERLIILLAQSLEALGKVHIEAAAFQTTQYWINVIASNELQPDKRLKKEQQAYIEDFNQLVLSTVKELEESEKKRSGILSSSFIVNKFASQVEVMMEKYPEYDQLNPYSIIAQDFMSKSQAMRIVDEADKVRIQKELEGKELGYHFLNTAQKVRASLNKSS